MNKKIENFLEKDVAFILLLAMAAAAVVGAASMFINYGTGLTNEIYIAAYIQDGLVTGDYSAALAFASGFLIARVLEGPLVGILDIGGSLMTGIGVGIPALLLSMGQGWIINGFVTALLFGLLFGAVIGAIIIIIRKIAPETGLEGATGIMMGAGNKTGEALGPLVILAAGSYNILIGVGAVVGSLLFYKFKKPIVGGAILGAILIGAVMMLLGIPVANV